MITKAKLTIDNEEREVLVGFHIVGGEHGIRDRYGAPETPDFPLSVEILEVTDRQGNDLSDSLSREQSTALKKQCWAYYEEVVNEP